MRPESLWCDGQGSVFNIQVYSLTGTAAGLTPYVLAFQHVYITTTETQDPRRPRGQSATIIQTCDPEQPPDINSCDWLLRVQADVRFPFG